MTKTKHFSIWFIAPERLRSKCLYNLECGNNTRFVNLILKQITPHSDQYLSFRKVSDPITESELINLSSSETHYWTWDTNYSVHFAQKSFG
jgi:hypothetical protein